MRVLNLMRISSRRKPGTGPNRAGTVSPECGKPRPPPLKC
jgi:hypothetical protein